MVARHMSKLSILPQSSYHRATWKNGRGYTDEIAIHPKDAELKRGNFKWRISSARIEQNSIFSTFPDHDRVLVILKGEGIRLFHRFDDEYPEELTELPQFEPYEFPGDIQSRCELISGPVQDLSVFIRKGEAQALVNVIELQADQPYPWTPSGQSGFAYIVSGGISCESGEAAVGDTLSSPGGTEVILQANDRGAKLILVDLHVEQDRLT
jgi:environmental stress-induced protein Ves